jgi:hypothetical protein
LDRPHANTLYLSATHTGNFFDESIDYLQWNRSTSNTPAPLVPDIPFTFDFVTALTNEPPFSDGFSDASSDLGSLFVHESDSPSLSWSSDNFWEFGNEYMSSSSSSDSFTVFSPELETFLATADPSLARGNVPTAADSTPLDLWGADDLPVSSSSKSGMLGFKMSDLGDDCTHIGSPEIDLMQYDMSNAEAQNFLGWEWQSSSTRWLDEGVSSEVCHFPQAIKVSERTRVSHVERVTGLPSQFPIPREATAFLINVTNIPNLDPDTTVDALLKDQVHPPPLLIDFQLKSFEGCSLVGRIHRQPFES